MIDLELVIKGEELKQKLGIKDGLNGSPDTADDIRNKLELLQGDDRLDKSAIRGLDDFEKDLTEVKNRPRGGGGLQRGVADELYMPLSGRSKTLTYNTDGTLHSMSDSIGSKTMIWSSGNLTGFTGTGFYRSKTFTYTGGVLTGVTVS